MAKPQVRVYDSGIILQGIVEDYKELVYQTSYYGVGSFSLEINKNLPSSELLLKKRFIQVGDDPKDSYIITSVKDSIDETGKVSQMIVVSGYDLKYIFSQRNITELNDIDSFFLSDAAETVIKTLISSQCGALCTNAKRVFSTLQIATDSAQGQTYSLSAKYTDVLSSCIKVASESGLGWYCSLDAVNKKIIVDCYEGVDRTQGQSVNTRCLFSPDSDSLKSAKFSDTITEYRNFVYVGGIGTGQDREIYEGFDGTEPEDLDRYEMFSDASNLTEDSELESRADSILTRYDQTYELDGEVLEKSPYVYKEQYAVGDIVTIKFNDHELDVRILDVTEAYSYLKYSIAITWGKPQSTIGSQLGNVASTVAGNSSASDSNTNVSGMRAGVKVYDISAADYEMDGSGCMYNILELAGTITEDRSFTFYLDTTRLFGRKVYTIAVSVVSDTGERAVTLKAGGTDLVLSVGDTASKTIYQVFIDSDGNVNGRKIASISDIEGLQDALDGKLGVSENAVSATKLVTARTIAGVSFDGTANIDLDTDNIAEGDNLYYTEARVSANVDVVANGDAIDDFEAITVPAPQENLLAAIDGRGFPFIPNDTDGRDYDSAGLWTNWDIYPSGGTSAVVNEELVITLDGTLAAVARIRSTIADSLYENKHFCMEFRVESNVKIERVQLYENSYYLINLESIGVNRYRASGYQQVASAPGLNIQMIADRNYSLNDKIILENVYFGSGAYLPKLDSTGQQILSNTAMVPVKGDYDWMLQGNGENSLATIPGTFFTGNDLFPIFIKPKTVGAVEYLLSDINYDSGYTGASLSILAGATLRLSVGDGTTTLINFDSTRVLSAGTLYGLTIRTDFSGGEVEFIWSDIATETISETVVFAESLAEETTIGNTGYPVSGGSFNGAISVFLFNDSSSLTDSEITSLLNDPTQIGYNQPQSPEPQSNAVVQYGADGELKGNVIDLVELTSLDTAQAGRAEFYEDRFYITNVGTRRAIDRTSDVIISDTEIVNTTTETTIYTGVIGANDLKAGNVLKLHCDGVLSNNSASDDITVKIYLGATEVLSFKPALGRVTDAHWHIDGNMTVRTVGSSGTMAYHLDMNLDDNVTSVIGKGSIDTTIVESFTVTITWDNAKADNTISIYQGYTEFKN